MTDKTRKLLIQLNKAFYRQNGHSFSNTRSTNWAGWEKFGATLQQMPQPVSLLDLGCGNGRLIDFLENRIECQYLGVDSSEILIETAKKMHPQSNFVVEEIDDFVHTHTQTYDCVSLFGVMHHIPSYNSRINLLKTLAKFLYKESILAVTFWQFADDPRLNKKILSWDNYDKIDPTDLELGDFLLPWQNSTFPRYCHHFSNKEIDDVIDKLSSIYTVDHRYHADGASQKLNSYVFFRKR